MTQGRLRLAIGALALAGAGIATYLTWARYADVQLICQTGGCETVQHSKYSKVAGIPVAVIGLAGYAFLFLTALLDRAWAAASAAAAAVAGWIFAVYLLVLQVAVIDAVCQWCVASDVVMTVIVVLAALRVRAASLSGAAAS